MKDIAIKMEDVCLDFPKKRGLLTLLKNWYRKEKTIFHALNNVNLSVKKGEVLGIIGKNGSGKSTMLRVISGIYPPNKGTCYAAGSISLLAGLGTGFSGHQTGRENAILYGSILGHEEKIMLQKLPEINEFSELGASLMSP